MPCLFYNFQLISNGTIIYYGAGHIELMIVENEQTENNDPEDENKSDSSNAEIMVQFLDGPYQG